MLEDGTVTHYDIIPILHNVPVEELEIKDIDNVVNDDKNKEVLGERKSEDKYLLADVLLDVRKSPRSSTPRRR